ncbi:MAG TPA: two-component regulator propeller domain-containing protein, partial [Flavisolibacter sp.]|nr:two-component regulator propeller domain-containing protein [Flavisolibacter sp.]
MTRTVVVALLLILSIHLPAQQGKQYSFKSFSVVNGLASNTVNAVVQDGDGYMWIATANGLQRYDGSDFITFKSKSNEAGAIPPTYVSRLFVDQKKRLWLAVDNKIAGRFDTKKFTFKAVPVETREEYFIQKFYELRSGELVILNFFGNFFRFDEKQDRFVEDHTVLPLPAGWKCTDISWDDKIRRYWLSCDSGLVLLDPVSRKISYKGHNTEAN